MEEAASLRAVPSVPALSRLSEEANLANEAVWKELTKLLFRRLTIHWEDPFVDVQRLCPRHTMIVVQLDEDLPYLETFAEINERLRDIFSAVARLSAWAARLRHWDDLSLDFWNRLVRTSMLKEKVESVWIHQWVRFVKANGIHFLLRWHGKKYPVAFLQSPLTEFLCEQKPRGCRGLPVSITLAFENCDLSVRHLTWLRSLLARVGNDDTNHQGEGSPSRPVIQGLHLQGNRLHTSHLDALASLLDDPATAQINELRLDNTEPKDATEVVSDAYVSAFRRVVAAALTSKAPGDEAGVSLSLGDRSTFKAQHLDAIYTAIQNATRPLEKLSLAYVTIDGVGAARQLGRLLFSPVYAVKDGSDIDLSAIPFSGAFARDNTLDDILSALPELITEAIARSGRDSVQIECQCIVQDVFSDENLVTLMPATLDAKQYYTVQGLSATGNVCLVIPAAEGASRQTVGWISPNSISSVRTASGQPLVGWAFAGLMADSHAPLLQRLAAHLKWLSVGHVGQNRHLTKLIGEKIQRLSLRRTFFQGCDDTFVLLQSCVNLQQLNLSQVRIEEYVEGPVWTQLLEMLPASLLALDVSGCKAMTAASMRSLSGFTRLRYLSLKGNYSWLAYHTPTYLLELIEDTPSLRYVDLDRLSDTWDDRHDKLEAILRGDKGEAAFLSVLSRLEARNPSWKHISDEAVASILEYANEGRAVVNWRTWVW